MVDLEKVYRLAQVVIVWENARAETAALQISEDGRKWVEVKRLVDVPAGRQEILLSGEKARFIRVQGIKRNTDYGYSIFELEAYPK